MIGCYGPLDPAVCYYIVNTFLFDVSCVSSTVWEVLGLICDFFLFLLHLIFFPFLLHFWFFFSVKKPFTDGSVCLSVSCVKKNRLEPWITCFYRLLWKSQCRIAKEKQDVFSLLWKNHYTFHLYFSKILNFIFFSSIWAGRMPKSSNLIG